MLEIYWLSPLPVSPFAGKNKNRYVSYFSGLNGLNRLNWPTQNTIDSFGLLPENFSKPILIMEKCYETRLPFFV